MMTFAPLIAGVLERGRGLGGRLHRFRAPLFVGALVLFLGGTAFSATQLHLDGQTLRWGPLAVLLAVLVPATLLYGAYGVLLLSSAARVPMDLGHAFRVSTYATLAEALPLPGGAMVRTAALVRLGGGLGSSTALVLGTAILWITLGAVGAGLAMVLHGTSVGWLLTVASGAVAAAICAWLWHRAGLQLALLVLLHRLFGLVLFAARLMLSFGALSLSVPLLDTLPFAFASIAGSASSIAPAGLGVGEAMAGMIAHSVAVAPAAAFLAVAINRIGGLAATAVVASILELASPRFPKSDSLT